MSTQTARDTDTNESDNNDGWRYAVYSRAEIYLRFRFAYLTDNTWMDNPVDDDAIPDAVQNVLDNHCYGCLMRDIENGDWERIDDMLLNVDAPAPTANTEHSSDSSSNQCIH